MADKDFTETPLEDILDHDAEPESASDPDIVEEPEAPAEEPKAETPEEPTPEPELETKQEPIMVPLAALQEVRDELKALKAQPPAAPPQEPESIPDPVEDPQGFNSYQDRRVQTVEERFSQQRLEDKLNLSEYHATRQYGADEVASVKEWFATQPQASQIEIQQHADPYGYAIEQRKTAELASKLSDPDMQKQFEAFLAQKDQPSPALKAPVTTAGARNVGNRSGPEWSGPTPLEEILPE